MSVAFVLVVVKSEANESVVEKAGCCGDDSNPNCYSNSTHVNNEHVHQPMPHSTSSFLSYL